MKTFSFKFDPRFRLLLVAFGATPQRSWVRIDDDELDIRFGFWTLRTRVDNIAGVTVTGPHRPLKAIGIRTSLSDLGLTFGSSAGRTVCIQFDRRVRVSPADIVAHPAVTVSVHDPDGLAAALRARM